uniref:Uncharacterized protein n=1 Tax=Hyaloperonospora arabidopsidis (strain Emoy2) TaxID=559515 RepID=M4B9P1_HYAAE
MAFLCDGQLLALTRKFNLTYQQMALLATSTLATCGLMGIAGFFVWRKGLFRKRYAALFGDEIYNEDGFSAAMSRSPAGEDGGALFGTEGEQKKKHSGATMTLGNSVHLMALWPFDSLSSTRRNSNWSSRVWGCR